jgi:hypothetical protein
MLCIDDTEQFQRQSINQQGNVEIKYDKEFLEWFIGFSEGDGSFYMRKGQL